MRGYHKHSPIPKCKGLNKNKSEMRRRKSMDLGALVSPEQEFSTHGIRVVLFPSGLSCISSAT